MTDIKVQLKSGSQVTIDVDSLRKLICNPSEKMKVDGDYSAAWLTSSVSTLQMIDSGMRDCKPS